MEDWQILSDRVHDFHRKHYQLKEGRLRVHLMLIWNLKVAILARNLLETQMY